MTGHLVDLGVTDYQDAHRLQVAIHRARAEGLVEDVLLLTEHEPVYTLGRTTRAEHTGKTGAGGRINGIPVQATDRGGSVTYHGPGQLVGYPIVKVRDHVAGPKAYVARLEETLIRALASFGIEAGRRPGSPGVWVGGRKIAAIGVRIERGVTRHGFSLNVTNDLTPYAAIVPCGLAGVEITSVAAERNAAVDRSQAVAAVKESFQEVFGLALHEERAADFIAAARNGFTAAARFYNGGI